MKPWELLGETCTPDGSQVRLTRQDTEYVILVDGKPLMSSRRHGSEEALATLGCQHARTMDEPQVLVGGLGMGFTLRATLDLLPPGAIVTVAELLPAIVEWNRGPLGSLADHPVKDPRVRIELGDVGRVLRASEPSGFDAILLDVDNGPAAFTVPQNAGLYDNAGVSAAYVALRAGGVLAVWSAWDDRKFEQRLRFHGFAVEVARVRARLKKGGPRHAIFVGVRGERG
jgi:spermidine synthase